MNDKRIRLHLISTLPQDTPVGPRDVGSLVAAGNIMMGEPEKVETEEQFIAQTEHRNNFIASLTKQTFDGTGQGTELEMNLEQFANLCVFLDRSEANLALVKLEVFTPRVGFKLAA